MVYKLDSREFLMVKELFKREFESVRKLQVALGISHRATFDVLSRIERKGLAITCMGRGKGRKVKATDELRRMMLEEDYELSSEQEDTGMFVKLDTELVRQLKMTAVLKGNKYKHLIEEYIKEGLSKEKEALEW